MCVLCIHAYVWYKCTYAYFVLLYMYIHKYILCLLIWNWGVADRTQILFSNYQLIQSFFLTLYRQIQVQLKFKKSSTSMKLPFLFSVVGNDFIPWSGITHTWHCHPSRVTVSSPSFPGLAPWETRQVSQLQKFWQNSTLDIKKIHKPYCCCC